MLGKYNSSATCPGLYTSFPVKIHILRLVQIRALFKKKETTLAVILN